MHVAAPHFFHGCFCPTNAWLPDAFVCIHGFFILYVSMFLFCDWIQFGVKFLSHVYEDWFGLFLYHTARDVATHEALLYNRFVVGGVLLCACVPLLLSCWIDIDCFEHLLTNTCVCVWQVQTVQPLTQTPVACASYFQMCADDRLTLCVFADQRNRGGHTHLGAFPNLHPHDRLRTLPPSNSRYLSDFWCCMFPPYTPALLYNCVSL